MIIIQSKASEQELEESIIASLQPESFMGSIEGIEDDKL